jgi:predicted Zn-dependent protease
MHTFFQPNHRLRSPLVGRTLLALAILGASMASVAQTDNVTLPDMGASADSILSRKEEEDYARALLMQMRAYEVLVEDPQISAFFSDMGYRLVAYSDRPDKAFTFVVLNEDTVNAFAAPGGVIALFSGMILTAEDESEIAGVLAHEIAHITQLHLYRTLEKTKAMTIPIALAMLGLVLAGGGGGEAIQGAMLTGSAALQQAQINFTRQHEAEADRIGIKTLSQAGYDPQGMVTFFEKMDRATRSAGQGPPEYLRTHPVNVSRIAEAGDRARRMPAPEQTSQLDFFLMQARLRTLVSESPVDALLYFEDRKQRADIDEDELQAIDYGTAMALQQQGKYEESRKMLDGLMALQPHLAYELQLADLDLVSGHDEAAIERLERLYSNFPGNHAIVMEYGRALLYDKDESRARQAQKILSEQILRNGDDPRLQELYARASEYSGNSVRASEAIAESYFLRGQIHEAVMQLTRLAEKPDLTYYQRARITARLDEMQETLAELGEESEQG